MSPKLTGVVIGKFYPPHRGHKYLIDVASKTVDEVYVIVCEKSEYKISGALRKKWIEEIHPRVQVLLVEDNLDPEDSEGWAKYTRKSLGFVPDYVFTSEDYGDAYAKFLGSKHYLVDKGRSHVPISATKIRNAPMECWDFLEPIVRLHFLKRIVFLGVESTGKSTIASALANLYSTVWVPEYGRTYWETKMTSQNQSMTWKTEEFTHIAEEQNKLEDQAALKASRLLFCDTNAFATSLWHERYMGFASDKVYEKSVGHHYDLWFLTDMDFPFVQDGTRDGEKIRSWMHNRFKEELTKKGTNFVVLKGSQEDRIKTVRAEIDRLLFNFRI